MFLKMMRKKREYDLAIIVVAILTFSILALVIAMMFLFIALIASAIF